MTTIRRRSRRRLESLDSITGIWDAGLPPPEWASQPGDHADELADLIFFGGDNYSGRHHPHASEWWNA